MQNDALTRLCVLLEVLVGTFPPKTSWKKDKNKKTTSANPSEGPKLVDKLPTVVEETRSVPPSLVAKLEALLNCQSCVAGKQVEQLWKSNVGNLGRCCQTKSDTC